MVSGKHLLLGEHGPKAKLSGRRLAFRIQLGLTTGKMWPGALLTLLLCSSLEAQENSFTINSISVEILPSQEVQSGENLTLQCGVDISTTSHAKPQRWVLSSKDDVLLRSVSSTEITEFYHPPSPGLRCKDIQMHCDSEQGENHTEHEVLLRGLPLPE